jgi:hypothetical protein
MSRSKRLPSLPRLPHIGNDGRDGNDFRVGHRQSPEEGVRMTRVGEPVRRIRVIPSRRMPPPAEPTAPKREREVPPRRPSPRPNREKTPA